jgi:hypothetical protein
MRPDTFSTTSLKRLQHQLLAWRRDRSGRPRLPEAVWRAATELARTAGPGRVARTLRLDYYKLRARLARTTSPADTSPPFVELQVAGPSAPGPGEAYVELADGTGARLILRVRDDAATLVALAQSFWRRQR